MSDEGERLSWRQACRLLGCGKTHFYKLVNSGVLPAYRQGSRGLWAYRTDCIKLIQRIGEEDENGEHDK